MKIPPSSDTRLDTEYILGMAKLDGGVKILLDIDRVLKSDEMEGSGRRRLISGNLINLEKYAPDLEIPGRGLFMFL